MQSGPVGLLLCRSGRDGLTEWILIKRSGPPGRFVVMSSVLYDIFTLVSKIFTFPFFLVIG